MCHQCRGMVACDPLPYRDAIEMMERRQKFIRQKSESQSSEQQPSRLSSSSSSCDSIWVLPGGDEVDLEAEDESTVRHCPQYDNTARPQTAASLWIFTDEETGEVMIANSDFLSQQN